MMTDVYVTIKREGRLVDIPIEYLSDDELDDFIAARPVERGWDFVKMMVRGLRNNSTGSED